VQGSISDCFFYENPDTGLFNPSYLINQLPVGLSARVCDENCAC
jgi:hypothetical protein